MATHEVPLLADEGIFRGLAKQNLLFHQCVCELVDNAIAAHPAKSKFRVDVLFLPPKGDELIDIFISDNSAGMSLDALKDALQLGKMPETTSRLNEHGFGLKNALATLSGGNGPWKVWTRPTGSKAVNSVEGPFRAKMIVRDDDVFPSVDDLPPDISTLIKVSVRLPFIQTVQGRGAPATNLVKLRDWLIEHLGVVYRGYLDLDPTTHETSGIIVCSIGNDSLKVPPIPVPLGTTETHYIKIDLGGHVQELTFLRGTLDPTKRDRLLGGKGAKFYYQGNTVTQGIDIRIGKRVIATKQFETIWKTENGENQLTRHNNFNDFVGELLVPELPRGVLTTVNNKTDFNLDDREWEKIFSELNKLRPPSQPREKSEATLRKKWMSMLKATSPEDTISDEKSVWPTGTKIDVFRKTSDGKTIIYELKAVSAAPLDLYQLKMYWDGLVLAGEQPTQGILLAEDSHSTLEEMANLMNKLPPPKGSKAYNFKIERLKDKGL